MKVIFSGRRINLYQRTKDVREKSPLFFWPCAADVLGVFTHRCVNIVTQWYMCVCVCVCMYDITHHIHILHIRDNVITKCQRLTEIFGGFRRDGRFIRRTCLRTQFSEKSLENARCFFLFYYERYTFKRLWTQTIVIFTVSNVGRGKGGILKKKFEPPSSPPRDCGLWTAGPIPIASKGSRSGRLYYYDVYGLKNKKQFRFFQVQ